MTVLTAPDVTGSKGPEVPGSRYVPAMSDGHAGDDRDLVDLTGRAVRIVVDLHAGAASATLWTSDLTAEYVHENSAYST